MSPPAPRQEEGAGGCRGAGGQGAGAGGQGAGAAVSTLLGGRRGCRLADVKLLLLLLAAVLELGDGEAGVVLQEGVAAHAAPAHHLGVRAGGGGEDGAVFKKTIVSQVVKIALQSFCQWVFLFVSWGRSATFFCSYILMSSKKNKTG